MYPLHTFSQTDTIVSIKVDSTQKSSSEKSLHSLYGGLGYGSNMIYLGSSISGNQPYGYSVISYGLKNKLYFTAAAFHLSDLQPYLAFYSFSAYYNQVVNSWFDFSLGLYRYHVDKSLADTLFSNFTYLDCSLGFDWNILYSKISAGGLFSIENQFYFQLKNSRYFQTHDIFKGKANVSFDPYVNLLFGSLIQVDTTSETYYTNSHMYGRWGQQGSNGYTITSSSTSRSFNLIEIDIGLPVALNFDSMTFEIEGSYVFPGYSDLTYPGPEGFVLLISGFFKIF